jgi:photosystem II stability/assembly factor-like uncharacterized protein
MRNKIIYIFFLLLFFCGNIFAQTYSWYWQNPRPQGNPLFKITTFDTSRAMAVGTIGTMISTSDGGLIWQVTHKTNGSDYWIWSTYYYNPTMGWAVGGNGTIFQTQDGGYTWTTRYSGTTSNLQSVFFLDMFRGWTVGWNGTILKTVDGGQSWLAQDSRTQADLYSVNFLNADTGFAVGIRGSGTTALVGEFLKTTDGGENWQQIKLGVDNRLWGITFENGVGWIYGWGGLILKSTDGGNTWSPKNPLLTESIYSINFPTESIGYAAGEGGILLKTTNKGDSWFELKRVTSDTIYSISFVDERIGWFVGENGIIFKTRDGGSNWSEQSTGLTKWITSTDFIGKIGWAAGEKGTIQKTTDNGVTWKDYSTRNVLYNDIKFPNVSTGFIAGNGGTIIKSTDGGESWRDIAPANSTQDFSGLYFIDNYTGFVVGGKKLLKTTNGGFNWTETLTTGSENYNKVFFLDNITGWLIGSAGFISKTSDGGTTWVRQNSPTSKSLFYIKFLNARLGWASGDDGVIIKTTDGGNNWQISNSGFGDEISKIFINDSLNLWAVGKWGYLFKSTDGGSSWSQIQSVTSNFLSTLYFPDVSNGLVFGKGGTILRFRDGAPKPVIGLSSGRLTFNAFKNGSLPASQSMIIFNSEGGSLNWSAVKTSSWLGITPSSGINTTSVFFSVNTTNLTVGTYYDSVTISDPVALNSPQKIYITYNIYEPGKQPVIDLGGVTSMLFEADQNGPLPPKQSFMIRNSGGSSLDWNVTDDALWLDENPISGQLGENIFSMDSVGVNRTDLQEGTYNSVININSPGAFNNPQTINVTYKIYSAPKFVLSDSILTFYATSYGQLPDSQSIMITNTGRQSFNWIGTKDVEWFDFNPKNGTDLAKLTIVIKNTNFTVGDMTGKIVLSSSGAVNSPATIKVILKIVPEALISVPYDSIVYSKTELGTFRDTIIAITNIGTSNLEISSQTFTGDNAALFQNLDASQITILPSERKELHYRFTPLKIGMKEADLELVSNATSINNGKIILPFVGYGVDTKPPDITAALTTSANYGDSIKIQAANATDLSGIKKFELWYRSSNQNWDVTRKRQIISTVNGFQYIPSSVVNQYGVDYRITAEDSAGNVGTLKNLAVSAKPSTFFSVPVRINDKYQIGSTFSTPGGDTKAFYRMFSSPINFDTIRAKDFWGYLGDHRYQWRFRVPVNGLDNWIDGENEVIRSGISYFIITRSPSTISGNTGITNKFENFNRDGIQLQKGFNFVGNPFTFEIPNGKLKFSDPNQNLVNNAWYYSGNYQWVLKESFKVWGGYCIYADSPTQLVVDEVITNNTLLKENEIGNGWDMQVIASDGELYDVSNYIGMKTNSQNKFDKNDFHEPPRFENGLALFFPHNDWDEKSGEYAGDYRELNSAGNEWEIKILAEKEKEIDLEFKPSENFPDNFSISLFDVDNLRFITVNNFKTNIGSGSGERNLKLIVGTNDYQKKSKLDLNTIPSEFRLYQNYPNPFNNSTNIFYHLPIAGNVQLEIFSVLGSKIRTLVQKFQTAGSYDLPFDAKEFASGVYFYRLTVDGAASFSSVKKMILMK